MAPFWFKGALFDLDGTLLDSEPHLYQAWVEVCRVRGRDFRGFDYGRIVGMPDLNAAEPVIAHFGFDDAPEDFYREWNAIARDLVERNADPCAGASDVLMRLSAAGVPMAVATSAPEPYMMDMLMRCKFLHLFRAVRSVDSIGRARGKPKPDIYLEAANDIGVAPEDCIGFEDAPAGVAALKAAGVFAVGIAGDVRMAIRLADEGADLVVPSLLDFDWNAVHA